MNSFQFVFNFASHKTEMKGEEENLIRFYYILAGLCKRAV